MGKLKQEPDSKAQMDPMIPYMDTSVTLLLMLLFTFNLNYGQHKYVVGKER